MRPRNHTLTGTVIYQGKHKAYDVFWNGGYIRCPVDVPVSVPLSEVPKLLNKNVFRAAPETLAALSRYNCEQFGQGIDGLWNGRDVFLVGSGGSLKGFDFPRLLGRKTIAINHTIEHFPEASALLFSDACFLDRTDFDLKTYKGLIFASTASGYIEYDQRPNVFIYRHARRVTDTFHNGLYHHVLSGLISINLSLVMGARRIFLLGYDMHYNNGHHFFGDKYGHQNYPEHKYNRKVEKFAAFLPWKRQIVNCTEGSAIPYFRHMNIDDALALPDNDIDGMFEGEDIYVIGGGPSLKGFDFSRLDGKITIAVNHSIEFYPRATACLFGDAIFLDRTDFDLKAYQGLIFCSACTKYNKYDNRQNVRVTNERSDRPGRTWDEGLYRKTSGILALNLALVMGARRVFLLGFDSHSYKNPDDMHFYGGIHGHTVNSGFYEDRNQFMSDFTWAEGRIFNCCPDSGITQFPRITIEEGLTGEC